MPAAFGPRDLNKAIKKENEGYQNDFSKKQVDTSKPWKSADPVRYNNLKDAPKIGSAAQKQTWKDGKVVPYNNNPNGPKIGVKPPGRTWAASRSRTPTTATRTIRSSCGPRAARRAASGPATSRRRPRTTTTEPPDLVIHREQ